MKIDGQYIREFYTFGNGRPLHQSPIKKFVMKMQSNEELLEKLQLSSGKYITYNPESGKIVAAKDRDAKNHFKQIEEVVKEIHKMEDQLNVLADCFNSLKMTEPVYDKIDSERERLTWKKNKQFKNLTAARNIVAMKFKLDQDAVDKDPHVAKWLAAYNGTCEEIENLPDHSLIVETINEILR